MVEEDEQLDRTDNQTSLVYVTRHQIVGTLLKQQVIVTLEHILLTQY